MVKNDQKAKFSTKIFEFFFSESIQNVSKRILNRKSWYRKNFLVENFFLGLYRSFENGHIVKMARVGSAYALRS